MKGPMVVTKTGLYQPTYGWLVQMLPDKKACEIEEKYFFPPLTRPLKFTLNFNLQPFLYSSYSRSG